MPFARRKEPARRHTAGSLDSMGLPEIVQTVALGSKTARLTVASPHGEGEISFEAGVAVHATTKRAVGDDAFLEIVGWESGTFLLEHDVVCDDRTVESDAMFLVLEGVRRRDEASSEVPPPEPHHSRPRRGGRGLVATAAAVIALAAAGGGAWLALRDDTLAAARAPTRAESPLPAAVASRAPAEPAPEPDAPQEEARPAPPAPRPRTAPEAAPVVAAAPEPVPPPRVEPPAATLRLVTTSRLKRGLLRVSWAGAVVHEEAIEASHRGARRFFRSLVGKGAETFRTDVVLPAGIGELTLALSIDGESTARTAVVLSSLPDSAAVVEVELGKRRIEATAATPLPDAGTDIASVVGESPR